MQHRVDQPLRPDLRQPALLVVPVDHRRHTGKQGRVGDATEARQGRGEVRRGLGALAHGLLVDLVLGVRVSLDGQQPSREDLVAVARGYLQGRAVAVRGAVPEQELGDLGVAVLAGRCQGARVRGAGAGLGRVALLVLGVGF